MDLIDIHTPKIDTITISSAIELNKHNVEKQEYYSTSENNLVKLKKIANWTSWSFRIYKTTETDLAWSTLVSDLEALNTGQPMDCEIDTIDNSGTVYSCYFDCHYDTCSEYPIKYIECNLYRMYSNGNEFVAVKSFALTYPNGGETVTIGDTINILWTSENIESTEALKINLYENGAYSSVITASTLNSGSFSWDTTGLSADTDYKIYVELLSDSGVNDLSDADFILESGSAIPSDFIAMYKMNDNLASTNVLDESSNSYDGISVRDTNLMSETGIIGNALGFNGSSDRIDFGNSQLPKPTNDITLSGWIKTNDSGSNTYFLSYYGDVWTGGTFSGVILRQNSTGTLQVSKATSDGSVITIVTSSSYNDNAWHNFTLTVSSTGGMTLYVDDSQDGYNSDTANIYYRSNARVSIGDAYDDSVGWRNSYFTGAIDQIRVYDYILSETEITAINDESI